MYSKKGLSAIIVSVLIVLITVAAVVVVYAVILPVFSSIDTFDFSSFELGVSLEGHTLYDANTRYAFVQVKRGNDNFELDRIEIIFLVNANSVVYEIDEEDGLVEPNGRKVYAFNLGLEGYKAPDSVKVVPILKVDNKQIELESSSKAKLIHGSIELTSEIIKEAENRHSVNYLELCENGVIDQFESCDDENKSSGNSSDAGGSSSGSDIDDEILPYASVAAGMTFTAVDPNSFPGRKYYVSTAGLDTNAGTSVYSPFKTIQKALATAQGADPNSPDIIIVASGQYITSPVRITKSNIKIVFEKGVELISKPIGDRLLYQDFGTKDFEFTHACMFSFENVSNVSLVGEGTFVKMEKQRYVQLPADYRKEFRHGIWIRGGSNILVQGLVIYNTGGDGICVEPVSYTSVGEGSYSSNVTVRNTVIDSAYRNGIAVISVDGLTMDTCIIRNTRGTSPESGIDFEPEQIYHRLKNIVIKNVEFENNNQTAMYIQADKMQNPDGGTSPAEPVDMLFENIRVEHDKGIQILRFFDNSPQIGVTFRDLVMYNTDWGVKLYTLPTKQISHFITVFFQILPGIILYLFIQFVIRKLGA